MGVGVSRVAEGEAGARVREARNCDEAWQMSRNDDAERRFERGGGAGSRAG